MVRTLSFGGVINTIKNSTNNTIIHKILSNPVLLSIVIVILISIIIINITSTTIDSNKLFKSMVFGILITTGLLFCHNNIITNQNNKQGKQEMTNYFSGMAENSTSNISNINRTSFNNINGGELDNLNVENFFMEN